MSAPQPAIPEAKKAYKAYTDEYFAQFDPETSRVVSKMGQWVSLELYIFKRLTDAPLIKIQDNFIILHELEIMRRWINRGK